MKKGIFTLFVLIAFACKEQPPASVEVIKFDDLKKIINAETHPITIVNFWATWCAPCVKELPQFEKLLEAEKDKGVRMVLVSFDFAEQLESKVLPFVKKHNLQSELVLLDETDYNSFIDKIDPSWSGAIPATLMIDHRNDKRAFFEKEFKSGELKETYSNFIQ